MNAGSDPLNFRSTDSRRAARRNGINWAIALALTLSVVLVLLDIIGVSVALPYVQGSFDSTPTEIAWVMTGFGIAAVVIIPLTAWLAGRFGSKRAFLFGLAFFLAAAFVCSLATTLPMLIGGRVLQGLGGGIVLGKSPAILLRTFPKEEKSLAQTAFWLCVMVCPLVGPLLGGYFAEMLGWRRIFLTEIPFGVLALVLASSFLPADNPMHRRRTAMDWPGLTLLALGLAALQLLLEKGPQSDGFASPSIVAVTALVSLAVFAWWELRAAHPVVNLRTWPARFQALAAGRVYSFILGLILSAVFTAALIFGRTNFPRFILIQIELFVLGLGTLAPTVDETQPATP